MRRVVLGPPGTGKTTRLLALARELTGRVAFMSHTRAAARELAQRSPSNDADFGTIHSFCFKALNLTQHQVVDSLKLREFGESVGLDFDDDPQALSILSILSYSNATGKDLNDAWVESHHPAPLSRCRWVIQSYINWKDANGFVDYDDMVGMAQGLEFPFDSVVVDEAQDLSLAQWRVIDAMTTHAQAVVLAGDDDQAIYQWAGADTRGLSRALQAGYVREVLGQSWRVPRAVHALAARIVQQIETREHKMYLPRDADGEVNSVSFYHMVDWKNFSGTLLYRDAPSVQDLVADLIRECVPFTSRSGQLSPWEGRHAQAVRLLHKLARLGTLTANEHARMTAAMLPDAARLLEGDDWKKLLDMPVSIVFDCNGLSYTRTQYLNTVDLVAQPQVFMSTIHTFKGAEDKHVALFLPMSERVMRSFAANPDAEHRVWYVGVTRAIETLTLIHGYGEYPIQ